MSSLSLLLFLSALISSPSLATSPSSSESSVLQRKGAKECEALGFTGLGLCSDCEQLASYVKDAQLVSECHHCCVTEESEGGQKYSEAVLEVCSRRVAYYADVLSFIQDKAPKFPKLKVTYRIGAAPKLIMKDATTGEQEVVRIDNWKTEHVEQFLQEKLLP